MKPEEATNAVPEGSPVTSTDNFPGAETDESGDIQNEEDRPHDQENENSEDSE